MYTGVSNGAIVMALQRIFRWGCTRYYRLVATLILVIGGIRMLKLLNAIKNKAYYMSSPKKCNCVLNSLFRGRACPGDQQAAIHMLSICYGITQGKNGRRIDYNPVELRRELLKERRKLLRLQQFCRTTYA